MCPTGETNRIEFKTFTPKFWRDCNKEKHVTFINVFLFVPYLIILSYFSGFFFSILAHRHYTKLNYNNLCLSS